MTDTNEMPYEIWCMKKDTGDIFADDQQWRFDLVKYVRADTLKPTTLTVSDERVKADLDLIEKTSGDLDHGIIGTRIRGNVGPIVTRAIGRIRAALVRAQGMTLPRLPEGYYYARIQQDSGGIWYIEVVNFQTGHFPDGIVGLTPRAAAEAAIEKINTHEKGKL